MLAASEISNIQLLAHTIRGLAMDAVQKANSGHPGMPMGCAEIGSVLWSRYLRFSPDTTWLGRDRFVLSAGHGSMLLYSLLHLFGCGLDLDELKNFRQWQSKTPGHPEYGFTAGVETTTGPLGQGFANGVGLAAASQFISARVRSELFPVRVLGIVSDGDLMEGITSEAASLAAHLRLGNLTYIYDDNEISIGGSTDVCFTEDVAARFRAYGWHVADVDGHDIAALDSTIGEAIACVDRPSLVVARTTIGKGSPNLSGSSDSHGSPLGAEEVRLTKEALGLDPDETFVVPDAVREYCGAIRARNIDLQKQWDESFRKVRPRYQKLTQTASDELREALFSELSPLDKEATRSISGKAIQIIAKHCENFIGGSADLEPSNKTLIREEGNFSSDDYSSRNLRFGVREHAMGAFVNGMSYHGGLLPYGATFLVFADYLRPSIRLAALSHIQSLFIFTHDSFWVGEDGPTHQPIEHIESLRIIPNLHVYRPADGAEVAAAYTRALERKDGPSALLFSRQNLRRIEREQDCSKEQLLLGAHVVFGHKESQRVLVATGSEVALACEAARVLDQQGVSLRVVSMPCVEDYMEQSEAVRSQIIPPGAKVASLEAGSTAMWKGRFGGVGLTMGIDHYGASAPGEELARQFGFSPEAVASKLQQYF